MIISVGIFMDKLYHQVYFVDFSDFFISFFFYCNSLDIYRQMFSLVFTDRYNDGKFCHQNSLQYTNRKILDLQNSRSGSWTPLDFKKS